LKTSAAEHQKKLEKDRHVFKNKFPYISVIDEASDFKLGMQLGFAKAHHQIPPKKWA